MKDILKRLPGLLLVLILIIPAMAYSTNSDMVNAVDETQIIQLAADNATAFTTIADVEDAAADSEHEFQAEAQTILDRLDTAGSNGDELINTFLRGNYEIPLDPVPDLIKNLSVDLRIHNIYQRRMRQDMPESIAALETRAIKMLKEVQRGNIKLVDKPDVASGQIATNKRPQDKVFTDDVLSRF